MGTVTKVLNSGTLSAALADHKLQKLLYQELRIIARSKRNQHFDQDATNTTTLVHECYLKLNNVNTDQTQWQSRRHFYATAALVMKQILIDQARNRLAEKRGGHATHLQLTDEQYHLESNCSQLLAINDLLEHLSSSQPEMVELVHLKYFIGLSMAEIADILNTPKRSVERRWRTTRATLHSLLTVDEDVE